MKSWFMVVSCFFAMIYPASGSPDSGRIRVDEVRWHPGSVLWRDPGAVETLDFVAGIGGEAFQPVPPFVFVDTLKGGVNPKIRVRDGRGRDWVLKWGPEAKTENIAGRLAWAAGYFVQPVYFVREGRIEGIRDLKSAAKFVEKDGRFRDARFQLWGLLKGHNWTWDYNPFVGSRELNGLKVLMALMSNWDNKDAREVGNVSSNVAIVEHAENGAVEYRYIVQDWGASLGKWGLPVCGRNKWDCDDYAKQSAKFVRRVDEKGLVDWNYSPSWHDITRDIRVEDVAWIMQYLGRITDEQLRAGLEASGATPAETACFAQAIRGRIEALREVASGVNESVTTRIRYASRRD